MGRQRFAGRLQGLSLRLFAGRVVGIGAALDVGVVSFFAVCREGIGE